ncbi:MAG: TfoX/Sxy family protein [Chloroflexota bacterium]|jgi:TfoX/Sxy family transcriptional regulator of competence genes
MAYDETLASRIRSLLAERDDVREQRMFGGLAFLVGGKMAVGIIGDDLMVRVGRDAYDEALARPHTRPMDFTGRPMKGMVYVAPDGIGTDRELAGWVDAGANFAASLHE